MMKAPSLNPAAAGEFLIHHVEKLVVGVIGLLALLMTWWGLSALQSQAVNVTRTPDAIATLARQAAATIDQATSAPVDRLPKVAPLGPRIDPWRPQQVKFAEPPQREFVMSRPFSFDLKKRTKPDVFPITDLQAVAGVAVFFDEAAEDRAGRLPPPVAAAPAPQSPPLGRGRGADDGHQGLLGVDGMVAPIMPELPPEEPIKPGKIAPFVVVTGLIPAAKQRAEFDRRFGDVSFREATRDVPQWAEYIVERTRDVAGAAPRWERLRLVNVARVGAAGGLPNVFTGGQDGPSLTPDNLPSGFFLQSDEAEIQYAAALPERVDAGWGEDAIHPWFKPKIEEMLAASIAVKEDAPPAVEATLAALADKPRSFRDKEVKLDGVLLDPESQRQKSVGLYKFGVGTSDEKTAIKPQLIGTREAVVFATSEDLGPKLMFDLAGGKPRSCNLLVRVDMVGKTPVARLLEIAFLDEAGEVVATRRELSPGPVVLAADGRVDPAFAELGAAVTRVENRLFRFVDLGVEPGAEYRYRVRFALRNPNVTLAVQHVADVAITKGDFLLAEFSPETSPVRIPDPTRVVARIMPRDAARKLKVRGDNVEVLVLAPSEITGNYALRSVVTTPGGSANVDLSLNKPGDTRNYGQPVTTERLLVDFRGAQEEKIDARNPVPLEPLEMLFLRPDGEFEVVTPADSELLVRKYRSTLFLPGTDLPEIGKPPRPIKAVP